MVMSYINAGAGMSRLNQLETISCHFFLTVYVFLLFSVVSATATVPALLPTVKT